MRMIHYALLAGLGLLLLLVIGGPRGRRLAGGGLRWLALSSAAALIITPFVWLVCCAFKAPSVLMTWDFLPPPSQWSSETINLGNLRELFKPRVTAEGDVSFWRYAGNSIFLASAGTVIQMVLCSMGGYALAKLRFRGKRAIMVFMLGTMVVPGMLFLAPVYRLAYRFGWLDSYAILLVPGSVSAFGIFLFRQAILRVPTELIESARIDGAGEWRIYLRIVMPLVRPMTGTFCLISFLGSWNNFLGPQIFITSQAKLTLPVALYQYMGLYSQQYGVFLAGTLVAIIPPAVLFLALQREFISGLTSGAVKG
jgi:multiple sugar transport system permease protein